MSRKTVERWSVILSAVVVCTATSWASAANPLILGEWDFDGDTALSAPSSTPASATYPTDETQQSGWTLGGDTSQLIVVDSGTVAGIPSTPNAFQQAFTTSATSSSVTFPNYDLSATSRSIEWSADIYVDFINGNNSEGWQMRMISRDSSIDAGLMRILRNGTSWRLYNGLQGSNGGGSPYGQDFNFDQWYEMRVVIDPDSTSSGKAYTYIDGVLQFTETWTGRGLSQTQNIEYFEIISVAGTGARFFIDNLEIAIPEPASAALLALGGLAMLRRKRRS